MWPRPHGSWYWRRDDPDVRLQVQLRRNLVRLAMASRRAHRLLVPGGAVQPADTGLFWATRPPRCRPAWALGSHEPTRCCTAGPGARGAEIGLEARRSQLGSRRGVATIGRQGARWPGATS